MNFIIILDNIDILILFFKKFLSFLKKIINVFYSKKFHEICTLYIVQIETERAINKLLHKTLIYIQLYHLSQIYYKLRLLAGSYINDFLKIILLKELIYPSLYFIQSIIIQLFK